MNSKKLKSVVNNLRKMGADDSLKIEQNEDGAPIIDSPEEAPPGTVAIYDTQSKQWGAYDL